VIKLLLKKNKKLNYQLYEHLISKHFRIEHYK